MNTKIISKEGYVFKRIHDQLLMGNEIILGIDYSTGVPREDLAEYYEEVLIDNWHDTTCSMRIVAPKELIHTYPELLLDLTAIKKLNIEKYGDNILIYCNFIDPEHQALIDASNGLIFIEENI